MAEPAIQLELHPPPANQPPQAGHQLQGGAQWLITTSKTALLCSSHQSEIWGLSREIRIPAVFPMFMCCIGSKGAQCGAACQTADKKQQTSSCKNATHHQKAFSVVHTFLFLKYMLLCFWHPQTPLMSSACFCLASAPSGTLQGVGTSADLPSDTQPPSVTGCWPPSSVRAACPSPVNWTSPLTASKMLN